jgi:hypothetical protein
VIRIKSLSLRAKLVSAFVIVGIVPACVLGWRIITATGAMADDIGQSYRVQAAVIADKIDRNLFERYGDVQAFGMNDAVLDQSSWYQVGADKNKIVAVSNKYANLYGFYLLSMMVDTSGRVIAVNDHDPTGKPIDTSWLYQKNFADASWFTDAMAGRFLTGDKSALTGTVVQDVYTDADVKRVYGGDGLVLGYSAPVKDRDGKVIGVWNNRAAFSLAEEIVAAAYVDAKTQGLGAMEITVIDRQGRILIDYDPTRDGTTTFKRDPNVIFKLNLATAGVEAARHLVAGKSGAIRSLHARKKIWQLAGYEASHGALGYPGLHWGVLVRVDERQALASIWTLQWQVIYVLLGTVVTLGSAAWFLAKAIARPLLGGIDALRVGSQQVASAAGQVASSSQSLSRGATEQAASLEETSASMEEMASMTRRNADNSHQAAALMADTERLVNGANDELREMVASMTAIKASSDKVANIIKTIDEIAFQTNILALNAAVEAARAGDAGMGFAVVADEVRALAQRSAQAAKDTSSLIEESITRSSEGQLKVAQVSTVIASITASAVQVKSLIEDVSAASRQQSQGIDQVSQAIVQMERVTQTTAATAEEGAAASEELNAQAESTMAVVSQLAGLVSGAAAATSGQMSVARSTRTPSTITARPV